MTIPAGLVKLMTQAPGARSATVSASRSIAGIVRSAKQMPPGPVVSCPSTPRASGTDSSTTRPSSRPTRMAREDEVGALDGVVEVGGDAERQLGAALAGEPAQHAAIRSIRPASRSCRTTSSNGSVSRLASSAP